MLKKSFFGGAKTAKFQNFGDAKISTQTHGDFDYLDKTNEIYFDSACQSLRPRPVIEAMREYYEKFNSCGDRVNHKWGAKLDEIVDATRAKILKMLKLSAKNYFVSFTQNTTYGINLLLSQIDTKSFKKIITSDIEHNSVFLPTLTFAKKHNLPREVISRNPDGSVDLAHDFSEAIVVMNATTNFDGRRLENLSELAKKIHAQGGILIVDAAQAFATNREILIGAEPEAICFSSHKIYGPSAGVMVVRRDLLKKIAPTFVGGGVVDDVERDDFTLSAKNADFAHTIFEPGLQLYGEIVGLNAALDWLDSCTKEDFAREREFAAEIFDFLKNSPKIELINEKPATMISFYHKEINSNLLAEALSDSGVMTRSGYFCVHYYLQKVKKYPQLLRISLGIHNNAQDIAKLKEILGKVVE